VAESTAALLGENGGDTLALSVEGDALRGCGPVRSIAFFRSGGEVGGVEGSCSFAMPTRLIILQSAAAMVLGTCLRVPVSKLLSTLRFLRGCWLESSYSPKAAM
jgi:hypothetical protein